jgi:hypothetical protein
MHRKRDDYEIDQNEKYLLTKKLKHEGILLYSKQSTNTFVIDGDKLPQNSRLNLPLPSKIPSQVYHFFCIGLFNTYENSRHQVQFLIENDDLVIHKKYMEIILQHLAQQQMQKVKCERDPIFLVLVSSYK